MHIPKSKLSNWPDHTLPRTKQQGNKAYLAKDFHQASALYTACLTSSEPFSTKLQAELYANRAACALAVKDYPAAVSDCKEAVRLDPLYAKAYYRLGSALRQLEQDDVGEAEAAAAVAVALTTEDETVRSM
ncbi:hypothetical protein HDV00_005176 [Rhizophlyctis rosea]|nr:hypothetical protein HDV00_005176 [Rhizophlyctis rosea]